MATTAPLHSSTPDWFRHWLDNGFREFQEQNRKEHNDLWDELTNEESGLPTRVADLVVPRVLDGVKDYLARDGSGAY